MIAKSDQAAQDFGRCDIGIDDGGNALIAGFGQSRRRSLRPAHIDEHRTRVPDLMQGQPARVWVERGIRIGHHQPLPVTIHQDGREGCRNSRNAADARRHHPLVADLPQECVACLVVADPRPEFNRTAESRDRDGCCGGHAGCGLHGTFR